MTHETAQEASVRETGGMLVAFHFTVELGTWSGCTCTRTPTWSPGP
ncbi:hypothetical protein AB0N16_14935 [Streptomyces sp. NPDC051105]